MIDHTEAEDGRQREELIERYVLGQLSPPEQAAFERRLARDPTLREDLRRERAIAQGVRRAGREELKRRIAVAAGHSPRGLHRPGIPWGRITALAAMLLIVTGIALWQRWFMPLPAGEPPAADRAASLESRAETPPEAGTEREAPPTADRKSPGAETNEVDRAMALTDHPKPPAPAAVDRRTAEVGKVATQKPAADEGQAWTYSSEGVVLSDRHAGTERPGDAKRAQSAPRSETRAKPEGSGGAARQAEDGRIYGVVIGSTADLSAPQGAAAGSRDTVTFSVTVRGDSVTITLPADAIGVETDAPLEARVTRISPDSVLIEAVGVRIRGFLPLHRPR
jgi:hypothetical protein